MRLDRVPIAGNENWGLGDGILQENSGVSLAPFVSPPDPWIFFLGSMGSHRKV